MISSPSRTTGHWKVIAGLALQPGGERAQPVAARSTGRRGRCRPRERPTNVGPLGGRGGGETVAQLPGSRVGTHLAAGLGIDERQHAHRGQLLFARVADLDGEDRVAVAQLAQGGDPVARAAEVGDEDDEAALAGDAHRALERRAERGGAAALGRRLVAQRQQQPEQAGAALARGQGAGVAAAERVDAEPVGPSGGEWPTTSATPSATSVLRRSAVPKCIEGEASRSSQVVSARSATGTRTCGARMRAVAFQSISRTSSPGT